jgi:hypothetical protein
MQLAHFSGYYADDDYKQAVERWKRERISFWSTLAHSIPDNFK